MTPTIAPNPASLSELPEDLVANILVESAKTSSFTDFLVVSKRIQGIAKRMIQLGPDGAPVDLNGRRLLINRATYSFGLPYFQRIPLDAYPSWLTKEPEILLAALKFDSSVWFRIDKDLKQNAAYLYQALKANPQILNYINLDDREVVNLKKALGLDLNQSYEELNFESMRTDQLKVWAIMFIHLSDGMEREGILNPIPTLQQRLSLHKMEELGLDLIQISSDALRFIPLSKPFVLKLICKQAELLERLPQDYRLDSDIAIEAIRGRSILMKSVSSTLKAKPQFMKDAIRANMSCIHHIPLDLRKDFLFMVDACTINPHALKYLGDNLRGDPVFFAKIAHLNDGKDPEVTHLFEKKQRKWAPESN